MGPYTFAVEMEWTVSLSDKCKHSEPTSPSILTCTGTMVCSLLQTGLTKPYQVSYLEPNDKGTSYEPSGERDFRTTGTGVG